MRAAHRGLPAFVVAGTVTDHERRGSPQGRHRATTQYGPSGPNPALAAVSCAAGFLSELVSYVPVKAEGARLWLPGVCAKQRIGFAAQGWGRRAETTVDQTLIRGLDTAFRVFVSGLSSV